MSGYHTKFYFDELFYSNFARYILHTGLNYSTACRKLFGTTPRYVSFYFANHLVQFAKAVIQCYSLTEKNIAHNHTLLPLFANFFSEEKFRDFESDMYFSSPSHLHGNSSIHFFEPFRYCIECAKEDRNSHGETYWHRVHNIPLIPVCVHHNCYIDTWSPSEEQIGKRLAVPADEVILYKKTSKQNYDIRLLEISTRLSDTLWKPNSLNKEELQSKATQRKIIKTYNRKSIFDVVALDEFKKYAVSFSGSIEIFALHHFDDVKMIFRKDWNGNHPILYVLFEKFVEEFQAHNKILHTTRTFDCINKICEQFNTANSTSFLEKKVYYKKNNGAQVTCDCCKMSYVIDVDRNKVIEVVDFGEKIINHVIKRRMSGESFRTMEKTMGLDRKILAKLAENKFRIYQKPTLDFDATLKRRREIWISELNSKDFKSIKISKIKLKTAYRWLLKNDGPWIVEMNRKYRIRKFNNIKLKSVSLNDDEILSEVKQKKEELLKGNIKRRITKTLLLKLVKFRNPSNLPRLPKTSNFLMAQTESVFEWKLRRLRSLKEDIKNGHEPYMSSSSILEKLKFRTGSLSASELELLNETLM